MTAAYCNRCGSPHDEGSCLRDRPEADDSARWEPDLHLVDAAMVGSQYMRRLDGPDRSWVVAGMRVKGLTAERIADLLHCSLRQVRTVASDPMTAVCLLYLNEAEVFAGEKRMSDAEITRLSAALTQADASATRYREQLGRVIDMLAIPEDERPAFGCGCPRSRYNVYVDPKTGKMACREHRRLAVQRHRERRRVTSTPAAAR